MTVSSDYPSLSSENAPSRLASIFDRDCWYAALTLEERRDIYRAQRDAVTEADLDYDRGRGLRQRLESHPAFRQSPGRLEKRLRMDGLAPAEFERIASLKTTWLKQHIQHHPSWLLVLRDAFVSEPDYSLSLEGRPLAGFLYLALPLIQRAYGSLGDVFGASSNASPLIADAEALARSAVEQFLPHLFEIVAKAAILEMNLASRMGILSGKTEEERFFSFVAMLKDREFAAGMLSQYPVLARDVVTSVELFLNAMTEMFQHLKDDWPSIERELFGGKAAGTVADLRIGQGDRHSGGHSVTILKFKDGRKLVYKPRSLRMESGLARLFERINRELPELDLRALKVLDRGDHGWLEFVEGRSADERNEISLFYRRLGAELAVLYAFQAIDYHFENILADADHPILIDCETLMSSNLFPTDDSISLWNSMQQSVLSTGLLPHRILLPKSPEGFDIGGMADVAGERLPDETPDWDVPPSDRMRLTYSAKPLEKGRNRPRLKGREVNMLEFLEEFVEGFSAVYDLFLEKRKEWFDEDGGVFEDFAGAKSRVLVRVTMGYGYLLRRVSHPDYGRDALDREWLLDHLWIGADEQPLLEKTISSERAALRRYDYPIFFASIGSRDLEDGDGGRIPRALPSSPIEAVRARLGRFSEDDKRKQIGIIRSTLAANRKDRVALRRHTVLPAAGSFPAKRLLKIAERAKEYLERTAIEGEDGVGWLGLRIGTVIFSEAEYDFQPLWIDLYSGVTGVALFLAAWSKTSSDARSEELARKALRSLESLVEEKLEGVEERLGGFDGWGGVLYGLTAVGRLLTDDSLFALAARTLARIERIIPEVKTADIITGAAGAILALLAYDAVTGEARGHAAAVRLGEYLVRTALPQKRGLAWKGHSTEPICGFAHGAAGIGYALLRLGAVTGEERFRETGIAAYEYERFRFRSEIRDWPDMRDAMKEMTRAEDVPRSCTWCNGAPGIGLSRLDSLRLVEDSQLSTEIRDAFDRTIERGFGISHSLCHGDFGNLVFLDRASRHPYCAAERERVCALANGVVESVEKEGFICGVQTGIETPGLMTGVAGIGLGALLLAEPELSVNPLLLKC